MSHRLCPRLMVDCCPMARLPWAITYLFGGGFNARALSRIAADATTHIRPKARRERSPAPPGPTCAATSRPRQNPSSRAIARAFFKDLEIETRAKPPPRFRERSPYTPVHMCSALIHATSPRERFAAESKSSPRRPGAKAHATPRRASVLPPGRARTADKRSGQAPWRRRKVVTSTTGATRLHNCFMGCISKVANENFRMFRRNIPKCCQRNLEFPNATSLLKKFD